MELPDIQPWVMFLALAYACLISKTQHYAVEESVDTDSVAKMQSLALADHTAE